MNNLQRQSDKVTLMMSLMEDWFNERPKEVFVPGVSYIRVAQPNNPLSDFTNLFQAVLENKWTQESHFTEQAQDLLSEITEQSFISFCNSGSSADLLAFSALSERFNTHKVVTTACGFPTTISPAIMARNEVTLIDSDPTTLAPNYEQLAEYYDSVGDDAGVILAHTLGFPFSEDQVIVDTPRSWHLFDCCDSLSSQSNSRPVGVNANLSTYSFYPAHHVNSVQGGAVCSNSKDLTTIVESYRNWGRSCYCPPNVDNTCGKIFSGKWGTLGHGYSHKYVTARMGYNLQFSELQAALLCSQLPMHQEIQEKRLSRFNYMKGLLSDLIDYFDFVYYDPTISTPSPFGFVLICKPPINRLKLIRYLEDHKIGTRLVFGGNLSRQPGFLPYVRSGQIQTPFPLTGADNITDNAFWISCNQNLTPSMLDYMVEIIHQAVKDVV